MPVDDPLPELEEVLRRAEAGLLPSQAHDWAHGAHDMAQGILETVASMQEHGKDAPTGKQKAALTNIHSAAMKWLGGTFTAPPRPAAGTITGSFRRLNPLTGKLETIVVQRKGKPKGKSA